MSFRLSFSVIPALVRHIRAGGYLMQLASQFLCSKQGIPVCAGVTDAMKAVGITEKSYPVGRI